MLRSQRRASGPWQPRSFGVRPPACLQAGTTPSQSSRASTNADSYSWLINSQYFRSLTGYFPLPPRYQALDTIDEFDLDDETLGQDLVSLDLGVITSSTSDDDISQLFRAAVAGISSNVPIVPPVASGSLPAPECATGGIVFPQPPVENNIQTFCAGHDQWGKLIVPPISYGNGKTNDGQTKVAGVVGNFPIPNSNNLLWLGVLYSRHACVGNFHFGIGQSDQDKTDHCKKRLLTVLNGCQTDTITAKLGGKLQDVCAVYYVTVAPPDEQPFYGWFANPGRLSCAPTNTTLLGGDSSPLAGTCTCSYPKFAGQTDVFKMPASNSCSDVKAKDLFFN